jgi:hypothetical protein
VGRPPSSPGKHEIKYEFMVDAFDQGRIFEEREVAAKWLGVPVELLIIGSIGS